MAARSAAHSGAKVAGVVYPLAALGIGVWTITSLEDPAVTGKAWVGAGAAVSSLIAGVVTSLLALTVWFAGSLRERVSTR